MEYSDSRIPNKKKGRQGVSRPFREVRSKGIFEPQFENGVRGNAISDPVSPAGPMSTNRAGDVLDPLAFAVYSKSSGKEIYAYQLLLTVFERSDSMENVATSPVGVLTGWPSSGANAVP